MDTSILRHCKKCQNDYPPTFDYFYADTRCKSGFRSPCKSCIQESDSTRKEHIQTYNQRYYQENAEEIKQDRQIYRQSHPDQIKQYNQLYTSTHPEQIALYYKDYASTHADTIKPYQQEYRPVYRAKNRDKINSHTRNRRARKRNAPGFHTAEDIQKQYERQKGRCYWCGQKLTKYHVDHITPLTRGGSNWPDNLVLACPHCNISRNNRLPHEWPEGGRLL